MFDIINSLSEEIDKIITFIAVIAAIIPYSRTFLKWITDKRFLKSVLNSKNKIFLITQSLFKPGMISQNLHEHCVFITKASVDSFQKIIINLLRINIKFVMYDADDKILDEINIGGPVTNTKTNAYINENFPNFYFSDEKRNKQLHEYFEVYGMYDNFMKYNDNFKGFIIENKDDQKTKSIELPIDGTTDYMFLIKMNSSDLGFESEQKTVHLLFGGTDIGTSVAVDFFTKNYKEIYKRAKNNHYFFAIPVSVTNHTPMISGIRDLTEYMFNKK
ncbi:MAG: hypothetical protein ACI4U0_05910 [Candidatus Aphodocola sp.]